MRYIETRNASIHSPIKRIRRPTSSTAGHEDLAVYIVDGFRISVRKPEHEPMVESALEPRLQRVIDRVSTVRTRDHRASLRMHPHAVNPGIQLLVYEQPLSTRSNVRRIQDELTRQLTLNVEVPRPGHRVHKIRQDCRDGRPRIRETGRRQRTYAGIRKTAPPNRRSEQRHTKCVGRRRRSVAQNVVEEQIVAYADSTADHGLVLAEDLRCKVRRCKVRRVRKAEPGREVVVVRVLLRDCIKRYVEASECREPYHVARRSVVLVPQPEIQTQVWPDPPGVIHKVRLLKRVRIINR